MENTAPLSPAAQAVYAAAQEVSWDWSSMTEAHFSVIVAAALRAAADQVVPPDPCGDDCCITQSEQIRSDMLAIAAELECSV